MTVQRNTRTVHIPSAPIKELDCTDICVFLAYKFVYLCSIYRSQENFLAETVSMYLYRQIQSSKSNRNRKPADATHLTSQLWTLDALSMSYDALITGVPL